MEQYLKKTRLSGVLGALGAAALAVGLSVLWFARLWGVTALALVAGCALGAMALLLLRLYRKRTVQSREMALRRHIGGEMALEELLTAPPRRAQFQAALWLAPRFPLEMIRATEEGVVCRLNGEKVLARLLNLHPEVAATPQDIVLAQRAAIACGAERVLLCVTGKLPQETERCVHGAKLRVTLLPRAEIARLAGHAAPATDAQLSALKARRSSRAGARDWRRHVLSKHRARAFFAYGLLLVFLYEATGLAYYPVPGLACLALGTLCRLPRRGADADG